MMFVKIERRVKPMDANRDFIESVDVPVFVRGLNEHLEDARIEMLKELASAEAYYNGFKDCIETVKNMLCSEIYRCGISADDYLG